MNRYRRWLRFRLRTLLAFTALCAIPSWIGSHMADYRAEQRVLAELRKTEASFQVENDVAPAPAAPANDPWARAAQGLVNFVPIYT